jgi:hypothetical protein
LATKSGWHERDWKQKSPQIDDVFQVILMPATPHRGVDNDLNLLWGKANRAANPSMHRPVFREWHQLNAVFHVGLNQNRRIRF